MKFEVLANDEDLASRTPQGVRGLKSVRRSNMGLTWKSHPARGAWIEIQEENTMAYNNEQSHPARGAWIEIT